MYYLVYWFKKKFWILFNKLAMLSTDFWCYLKKINILELSFILVLQSPVGLGEIFHLSLFGNDGIRPSAIVFGKQKLEIRMISST